MLYSYHRRLEKRGEEMKKFVKYFMILMTLTLLMGSIKVNAEDQGNTNKNWAILQEKIKTSDLIKNENDYRTNYDSGAFADSEISAFVLTVKSGETLLNSTRYSYNAKTGIMSFQMSEIDDNYRFINAKLSNNFNQGTLKFISEIFGYDNETMKKWINENPKATVETDGFAYTVKQYTATETSELAGTSNAPITTYETFQIDLKNGIKPLNKVEDNKTETNNKEENKEEVEAPDTLANKSMWIVTCAGLFVIVGGAIFYYNLIPKKQETEE